MPPFAPPEPTEVCPGCGAVLVRLADGRVPAPGASGSCARLFEVTLRGLREEAATDAGAAAVIRLADAAYDAQHPDPGDPDRLALGPRGSRRDVPLPGVAPERVADDDRRRGR